MDCRTRPELRFYDNEVPGFVEAELERLYQCTMTTLARFDIYQAAPNASTCVFLAGGQVSAVFLFTIDGAEARVHNEQVRIDGAELDLLARALFGRYPAVRVVSFYAIDTDARAIRYPLQRHQCLEDIVLALPPTADDYLALLGKNTRASIRRYLGKVRRDFPSFRFEVYTGAAAGDERVRQVIGFSRERMRAKGEPCHHTERTTGQLARLARKYGVVGIATIDGRICAGVICFRVGASYLMQVLAHDPRYDDYRLGKLCCYLSIADAIAQGGREYHFGWGRADYKFRMLGKLRELYRIRVYRSHLAVLRDAPVLAATAANAARRQLTQRVERARAGATRTDRWIAAAADLARRAKRLLRRGPCP